MALVEESGNTSLAPAPRIPEPKGFGLKDAWIIAALPVLAYYYDFLYQSGYCDFFAIPRELISIDPSSIVRTAVYLFTALVLLLAYSPWSVSMKRKGSRPSHARRLVPLTLGYLLITVVFAFAANGLIADYDKGGRYGIGPPMIFALIAALAQALLYAISALLIGLVLGTISFLLLSFLRRLAIGLTIRPTSWIQSHVTMRNALFASLLLFLALGGLVCYFGGVNDARHDLFFLSSSNHKSRLAVVRIFGNTLIEEPVTPSGFYTQTVVVEQLTDHKTITLDRIGIQRRELSHAQSAELDTVLSFLTLMIIVAPLIGVHLARGLGTLTPSDRASGN